MSTSPEGSSPPYPDVPPQPRYAEIEERVLQSWEEDGTFKDSIQNREGGANEYVFYDGPPFANGLPHYGHLLTGYVKDVVPRYQTMRGRRVERRFGWDCHGLPAEMEAERQLGISGRQAIEEYGIEKFNDFCRTSIMRYTGEWQRYVTRMARWVDFENDYKTMDLSYMESVMWAFKQLWEKGLVYEGYKVMPYSWAAETPLSNFEIRLEDATRPKQDPAITVAFRLEPAGGDPGPLELLIWTTTPWTLPSNLGVAVGPEIDYAILRKEDRFFLLGAETVSKYEKEFGEAERVGSLKGADLVGRAYEPPFPYFKDHPGAHRILSADFVETEEGTGLVHMAPYGEDDQKALEGIGVQLVDPVDEQGRFTSEVSDYAGEHVFEANKGIVRALKERGVLLRHESYVHNYPHCWRTDTPIIYKPLRSWYVEVPKIRDRMLELNQDINWIPGHIRDGQFGRWLENARDWSISRSRFWGSPIPVWKSDNPDYPRVDVYGSIEELERDFGQKVTDLHRPFVDRLVRPNPDDPTGKSMMRRVPHVLDCWFESGSMPFAQVHYPFENKEWFEDHFPADFIVEFVAQTRGWFYTLMVMATALFDRAPFRNCICHGILGAADGRKLSKRLRNYLDPEIAVDRYGSDALRWLLMSSPLMRGADLRVEEDGQDIAEVVRLVLNPIWSAYYFFTLYANPDGIRAEVRSEATSVLDRYILAKTRDLVESVTTRMDAYDVAGACRRIAGFMDALNNWYIRRSRNRFWKAEKDQDKRDAYDTLLTALVTLCRVSAPFLPLLMEEIHRGLTGERSVHLCDWPNAEALPADPELVRDMDRVRAVCSTALGVREAHNLKIRLPLRKAVVAGTGSGRLAPFADLIRDELNVKEVEFSEELERFGNFRLQVNARQVGPRLGQDMKRCMAASRSGDWKILPDGGVEVGGLRLEPGEFELKLMAKEGVASQALPTNDAVVVLDVEVDDELRQEGVARDLVRLVQVARKDAGLHVSDRIRLTLGLSETARTAVQKHESYLTEQTLADEVRYGDVPDGGELKLSGEPVSVAVERAG